MREKRLLNIGHVVLEFGVLQKLKISDVCVGLGSRYMRDDKYLAIEQNAIKSSWIFRPLPSFDNEARCVRDVDVLNISKSR